MKVPIPFGGWIDVDDLEDISEMLRQQIHAQQSEIIRLTMENQAAYQKGWSDAITAATERARKMFDDEFNPRS